MDRTKVAFSLDAKDNVVTLLESVDAGNVVHVRGATASTEVVASEHIESTHKIAVRRIAAGAPVTKYGVSIGHATTEITAGSWVHLHNLASNYDERSSTLDNVTGAATDTVYE